MEGRLQLHVSGTVDAERLRNWPPDCIREFFDGLVRALAASAGWGAEESGEDRPMEAAGVQEVREPGVLAPDLEAVAAELGVLSSNVYARGVLLPKGVLQQIAEKLRAHRCGGAELPEVLAATLRDLDRASSFLQVVDHPIGLREAVKDATERILRHRSAPPPEAVAEVVKTIREFLLPNLHADLPPKGAAMVQVREELRRAADRLSSAVAPASQGREGSEETVMQEIRGAIARGWCHPANAGKVMDVELAEAAAVEVAKLFYRTLPAPPAAAPQEGACARALRPLVAFLGERLHRGPLRPGECDFGHLGDRCYSPGHYWTRAEWIDHRLGEVDRVAGLFGAARAALAGQPSTSTAEPATLGEPECRCGDCEASQGPQRASVYPPAALEEQAGERERAGVYHAPAEILGLQCGRSSGGWLCTRPLDHPPPHAAHGTDDEQYATWRDGEAPVRSDVPAPAPGARAATNCRCPLHGPPR